MELYKFYVLLDNLSALYRVAPKNKTLSLISIKSY